MRSVEPCAPGIRVLQGAAVGRAQQITDLGTVWTHLDGVAIRCRCRPQGEVMTVDITLRALWSYQYHLA